MTNYGGFIALDRTRIPNRAMPYVAQNAETVARRIIGTAPFTLTAPRAGEWFATIDGATTAAVAIYSDTPRIREAMGIPQTRTGHILP